MAYKINYIPVGKRQYSAKHTLPSRFFPASIILLISVAFFTLAVRYGNADWLLPGDPAVTKDAFEELIENLKAGEAFVNAVTAFCHEVTGSGA